MPSRYASVLVLTLTLPCLTAPAARAAAPGTASGTLTVNGKPVPLAYAMATTQKNPFDAKKTDVLLLLTNVPVDPAAMADDFGRMKLAGKGNFSGVEVEVDPDGQVISGTLYSPDFKKFNGMISATGMHQFEGKVSASSIDGKLFIPKDDDFAGYTYRYEATFQAPIAARGAAVVAGSAPLAGKPLAADGGAPGKAYRGYLAALAAGDETKLAKCVDAEHAAQMKDPEFKKMLKVIQAMEPKNVRIVRGSSDGNKATLEVTGKDGTETSNGTVELVMEGGAWKLAKESWSTKG
jgi:hypothetical protein